MKWQSGPSSLKLSISSLIIGLSSPQESRPQCQRKLYKHNVHRCVDECTNWWRSLFTEAHGRDTPPPPPRTSPRRDRYPLSAVVRTQLQYWPPAGRHIPSDGTKLAQRCITRSGLSPLSRGGRFTVYTVIHIIAVQRGQSGSRGLISHPMPLQVAGCSRRSGSRAPAARSRVRAPQFDGFIVLQRGGGDNVLGGMAGSAEDHVWKSP